MRRALLVHDCAQVSNLPALASFYPTPAQDFASTNSTSL
jgi:hypothetical protein